MFNRKQLRFLYGLLFLLVFFLSTCRPTFQLHEDPFYNNIGKSDSLRFPLIKPYYLVYIDQKTSWQMPLLADPPSESTYYYFNLHDIRKLSVENGVIMLYTPYVENNIDQSLDQRIYHWFVIVPASNIEEGFENENAFLEYIKQVDVYQPIWLDPNEVYEQFFQTGCLKWIPECK